jgi:predicted ATPase
MATTLRDGGIVLIDEPDLHIHVVMIPQLLGSIETIVRERRGQLIVASHSQEVWDWFSLSRERIELAPWRRTAT